MVPVDCAHPTYRYVLEQLANCKNVRCDDTQVTKIIGVMKSIKHTQLDQAQDQGDGSKNIISDYEAFKGIQKNLQTFSIQMELKLKAGAISKFPVQYFTKSGVDDGMDVWTLNEPSLLGKVFDLKRNNNQISIASSNETTIYIGPNTERRALDIVSHEAKTVFENDIIRMNFVGYVKLADNGPTDKMVTVPISINLPGLPPVDVQAVVQPGYSTYVALDYTKLNQ